MSDLKTKVKNNMERWREYYMVKMTDGVWCYGLSVDTLIETTRAYIILHSASIKGSTNE